MSCEMWAFKRESTRGDLATPVPQPLATKREGQKPQGQAETLNPKSRSDIREEIPEGKLSVMLDC